MLLDPQLAAWEILKESILKAVGRQEPDIYERDIIEALTSRSIRAKSPEEQSKAATSILEGGLRQHVDLARIEMLIHNYAWSETGHKLVLCEKEAINENQWEWADGLVPIAESSTVDGDEKTLPVAVGDVLDEHILDAGKKATDEHMTRRGGYTSDSDVFEIMIAGTHADKMKFQRYLEKMVEENPDNITEGKHGWFDRQMRIRRQGPKSTKALEALMGDTEGLTEKEVRGKKKRMQKQVDRVNAFDILKNHYRSKAASDYILVKQGRLVHGTDCHSHPKHSEQAALEKVHEINCANHKKHPEYSALAEALLSCDCPTYAEKHKLKGCDCPSLWDISREQAIESLDPDNPHDMSHPDFRNLHKVVAQHFQDSTAILTSSQGVQARNREGAEIAHKPRMERWMNWWKALPVDVRKAMMGLTAYNPVSGTYMPYLYFMFKGKGLGAGGRQIPEGEVTWILDNLARYE